MTHRFSFTAGMMAAAFVGMLATIAAAAGMALHLEPPPPAVWFGGWGGLGVVMGVLTGYLYR